MSTFFLEAAIHELSLHVSIVPFARDALVSALSRLSQLRVLELHHLLFDAISEEVSLRMRAGMRELTRLELGWSSVEGIGMAGVVAALTKLQHLHLTFEGSARPKLPGQSLRQTIGALVNMTGLSNLQIEHATTHDVQLLGGCLHALTALTRLVLDDCLCFRPSDQLMQQQQTIVCKVFRAVAVGISRIRGLVHLHLHIRGIPYVNLGLEFAFGSRFILVRRLLYCALVINSKLERVKFGGAADVFVSEDIKKYLFDHGTLDVDAD